MVLKSGRELPADVIVHANGFKTDKYFLQAEIVGTDGSLENYVSGCPASLSGHFILRLLT